MHSTKSNLIFATWVLIELCQFSLYNGMKYFLMDHSLFFSNYILDIISEKLYWSLRKDFKPLWYSVTFLSQRRRKAIPPNSRKRFWWDRKEVDHLNCALERCTVGSLPSFFQNSSWLIESPNLILEDLPCFRKSQSWYYGFTPVWIPSPALRGFWWYRISIFGPFRQQGKYIKKATFEGSFFMFSH